MKKMMSLNSKKMKLFFIFMTTVLPLTLFLHSCSSPTNPDSGATPPPPGGITLSEYNSMSQEWSHLWQEQVGGSFAVTGLDSTIGGRYTVAQLKAVIDALPDDAYIYFRLARDPGNRKISVMIKGGSDPANPVIYRNSGENFCPAMCD